MKTNFITLIKKVTTLILVFSMVFSFSSTSYAAQKNTWNKGEKVNYVPAVGASLYKSSDWTKNLVNLYQLKWYENPTREVLKGEFMLVQLRTIQASLQRRNLPLLDASKETLKFKDISTLTKSAQAEAKILKSLGILSGTSDGYMKINVPIKRSEAAKVLAVANSKVLNIPSVRTTKIFEDTKGHWSEKSVSIAYQTTLINGASATKFNPNDSLTIEQTLQILENEVGYFGITRADVAKAMNETFKVTLDTTSSNSLVTKNSYTKYEEKMKTYGFDQLYDNKSAKSTETVTKSEAIKLALGVIFNVYDAHDFGPLRDNAIEDNTEYPNANWVDYARFNKLLSEDVNASNYNDKAKYIEVISLFESCKKEYLKDYPVKDTKVYLKDIGNYSLDEQKAIKDMLANNIIYPVSDALKANDHIFKGQLNELVVNFAERYSTIAIGNEKVVTDPEKMPSNAYLFAYISSDVDKEVYEKNMPIRYKEENTPKEVYKKFKMDYPQAKKHIEEGYNAILNVDYRTITKENFLEGVRDYFIFPPDDYMIEYYVNYVKENKIIIKGKAELQSPIIYVSDIILLSRVKLNFEIVNSNTKYNLIFLDFYGSKNVIYQKLNYSIFADIRLSSKIGSPILYLEAQELYMRMLDKEKSGIMQEK